MPSDDKCDCKLYEKCPHLSFNGSTYVTTPKKEYLSVRYCVFFGRLDAPLADAEWIANAKDEETAKKIVSALREKENSK